MSAKIAGMAYDKDTPFEIVAIVAALFGDEYGQKVRDQFAGGSVFVPLRWAPRHPLASILGRERMTELCGEIGGVSFYVSTQKAQRRAAEVIRLSQQGMSVIPIGKTVGITERQVRHILSRHRASLQAQQP